MLHPNSIYNTTCIYSDILQYSMSHSIPLHYIKILETGGVGTKGGGGGKRRKLVVGNTLLLRSANVTGPRGNSMCISSVPWRPERGSTKHFSTQKGVAQWLTLLLHHQRWLRHVKALCRMRYGCRKPEGTGMVTETGAQTLGSWSASTFDSPSAMSVARI